MLRQLLSYGLITLSIVQGTLVFAQESPRDYYGVTLNFGVCPEDFKNKHSVYGISLSPLMIDSGQVRRIGVNGALWTISSESVGLGCSFIHWEDKVKGLQIGVISAGAVEVHGVQMGFVTGWGLRNYHLQPWISKVHGGQIGVFNLSESAWFQLGGYNFTEDTCGAQLGFLNYYKAEYTSSSSFQLGICNVVSSRKMLLEKNRVFQLGLFNSVNGSTKSVTQGDFLQIGLLNRTRTGWWLPISNFGL